MFSVLQVWLLRLCIVWRESGLTLSTVQSQQGHKWVIAGRQQGHSDLSSYIYKDAYVNQIW